MKKYYITTPLYYVNAAPHIGHAYTTVAADALARFKRLMGREVLFLTGTDEHGQKIQKAADADGLTPKAFTDKMAPIFKELWKTLDVSHDDFIRTTEERHLKAVAEVWKRLEAKGEIRKGRYAGWYCTPCETFWTEGQVEGAPALCPDCKRPVERLEEENYFFKLSNHQKWLIETVRDGSQMRVLPESRKNEVLGFLENNELQDLCISRPKNRLAWGIPVPLSPDHVTYVWFDALINYITAAGFAADEKKFKETWPADAHLIGKDILRHHAVIWPAVLHALGLELPRMVFAHGWWVQGGQKMSKSRGNVTDPNEIVKICGIDGFRYFLLRETTFGQDGTFSVGALALRYNTDLANDLGNLLHRSLTMCEKYFGGTVPGLPELPAGSAIADDARQLKAKAVNLFGQVESSLNVLAFSEALSAIWDVVSHANKFVERSAPWTLFKEKKEAELKYVIITLVEILKVVAQLIRPFMPSTADAIWKQLGIQAPIGKLHKQSEKWEYTMFGTSVAKGAPLFPKIEIKDEA